MVDYGRSQMSRADRLLKNNFLRNLLNENYKDVLMSRMKEVTGHHNCLSFYTN